MGTEPEPEIVFCENCDADVIAEEAVVSSKNRLLCQTCDDNGVDQEEDV